jgi:hypothetical protein
MITGTRCFISLELGTEIVRGSTKKQAAEARTGRKIGDRSISPEISKKILLLFGNGQKIFYLCTVKLR